MSRASAIAGLFLGFVGLSAGSLGCGGGTCDSLDDAFTAPVSYATGSGSRTVTAADLNGDGKPDLVVPNENSSTVSVLLNRGDGTFAAAASYEVGWGASSAVAADVNGDGKPDLAVAVFDRLGTDLPYDSYVGVLLNNGNGTFAAPVNYWVTDRPSSIAAADLNGDGWPDLALTMGDFSSKPRVSVLMNQGSGIFTNVGIEREVDESASSIAAADLNGDGGPDLVVANSGYEDEGSVSVLLNQGDSTFARVDYAAGSSPVSALGVDLNGDGSLDLAVANFRGDSVSVLLNDGRGTFAAADSYAAGGARPASVAAADLNGDGTPDLAVANSRSDDVSVLLNLGGGTFAAAVNYAVGNDPISVAAADLNGDGSTDLAVASSDSKTVSVLLNTCVF